MRNNASGQGGFGSIDQALISFASNRYGGLGAWGAEKSEDPDGAVMWMQNQTW